MKNAAAHEIPTLTSSIGPEFISESFDRLTNSKLRAGCDVRLLKDAEENYPAWIEAIENAEKRIFFESFIIHGDEQGELFTELLSEKARSGVDVKVIYDWAGAFGKRSRKLWRRLREAGAEVRCFNPPNLLDPLGFLVRDHRKCLIVDGEIAFVSGLCVGQDWVGRSERGAAPWRDTGVSIRGSAVADVEFAFAQIWKEMGPPLESAEISSVGEHDQPGNTNLRIIGGVPSSSYVYRMDQFLAAGARSTIWLTDAYFVGIPSYLQSLKDAASDGVDVRILVPQTTDLILIRDTTRSTYRPLLESGVRVFEWKGSMVHAKTAVFDGKFSRVGSTNLNIASWFGNYELDVLIEGENFGTKMKEMFEADLANSTEIVLSASKLQRPPKNPKQRRNLRPNSGSVSKATAGAIGAAASIGSAITKKTPLGPAESRLLAFVGTVLLFAALALIVFPRIASLPIIVFLLMLALPTLAKALKYYRDH